MVHRLLTSILCGAGLVLAGKYADLSKRDVLEVCADVGNWQDNQMNELNQKIVDKYAGTDNEIITMITDEDCDADTISDCVSAHQSGLISTVIKAVFPLVFPPLMLILWILFFMPCACCRCCRRCRCWCCCREDREARNFGKTKKVVIGIWATLFLAGFAVAAAIAALSAGQFKAGGEGAICEVYKFVDTTLNGFVPPPGANDQFGNELKPFVGMLPAVDKFADIADELDSGSTFLTGVSSLVDNTKSIENAVYVFSSRLEALKETLQDNTNKGSYYKCVFCEVSEDSINGIIDVLDNSLAGLLKAARGAVKDQLQGSAVQDTRKTLQDSQKPIEEIGTQVENSLGKLFVDNRDMVQNAVDMVSLGGLAVALTVILPGLLLLMTVTCGAFCSRRETYRDPAVRPQNACHASTSWCITCLWAFLVLLLTAVLLVVGFMSASACIVLQDIDVYVEALVAKSGSPQKTQDQMVAIVTNCFSEGGSGEFTNEIEIDLGSGKTQTLAEALDVSAIVNEPFKKLTDAIASQGASNIAADATLVDFLDTLEQWGAVYTVSDPSGLVTATGADLSESLVEKFLKLTATCAAVTVPDNDFANAVKSALETQPGSNAGELDVLGQEAFNSAVSTGGYDLVTGNANTCHTVSAFVASTGVEETLRQLAKKAAEVREESYDCTSVTFATVDGYDVATESKASCGGNGLDDYAQFITTAVADLKTAAQDIDTAAGTVQSDIVTDLQDLVKDAFLDPMDEIVDGINCQFLGMRWNEMVNAICRTMVPGLMATAFCWLAMAVIAWAAIFIEFSIWRRLKDNRSLWLDEVRRQRQ